MKMWLILLSVACGGAIGAVTRFWISELIYQHFNTIFPFGTLSVNLIGCYLIGFLWNIFGNFAVPEYIKMFMSVGILGALTTFSSYAIGTVNLLRDGEYLYAVLNILINNGLCILLVVLGIITSQVLINIFN
ncbi:MAG: fluoride efflux transporter CrcB [Candidatus Auribacterota bacterium]